MHTLELQEIHKGFHREEGFYPVLRGVSLCIAAGELTALLGQSGCGKTTLLRIAAGFEQPDQGQVLLGGAPVSRPSPRGMVVFQSFDQLFPWRQVKSNIVFALRTVRRGISTQQAGTIADYWLRETGLADCADRWPGELSGGMKQRAALARAFALEPELLLLDEPFAGLDAVLRTSMQQLLRRLCAQQQCAALFVTHDIDEALFLSPEPVVMTVDGSAIIRVQSEESVRTEIRRLLSGGQ